MTGALDPFEFVLAKSLAMTVDELRDRMSNQEFTQWAAFHRWRAAQRELAAQEPIGG